MRTMSWYDWRTSGSTTRAEREQGALQGDASEQRGNPSETATADRAGRKAALCNLFDDPNAPTPTGEPLERSPLRQEVRDTIEAAAPTNEQGQFIDADGNVIQDPHYGHRGHENRNNCCRRPRPGLTQAKLPSTPCAPGIFPD